MVLIGWILYLNIYWRRIWISTIDVFFGYIIFCWYFSSWGKTILKLTSLAEVISKVEACLTASLNTLDMALWDFSQEKEPPAIEEKVSYAL